MTNKIIKMKESIKLNVDVYVVQEEEYFVAYCPALELSAYADSVEKAKKAFNTEVKIFLEETHKRGTLEKYLLKNGWRLQNMPKFIYEPPRPDSNKFPNLHNPRGNVFKQEVNIPVC